jgi:hypothetical protein
MSIATSTKARSITTLARQANFGRWRFSTETGNGCYLTRILGGVDQATELRALNTASGFINSLSTSGLEATVVAIGGTSGRRVGYRLKVTDLRAREEAMQAHEERRQAALAETRTATPAEFAYDGGATATAARELADPTTEAGAKLAAAVEETRATAARQQGRSDRIAALLSTWRYVRRTDADGYSVRDGSGSEVGTLRRSTPAHVTRNPRWEAWDADGIRRVFGALSRADATQRLAEGIVGRAMDTEERERWAAEESKRWTPDEVLPSGRFGVRIVEVTNDTTTVQVVQLLSSGRWGATPVRYTAETITDLADATGPLAIDYGAGWNLPVEDTQALGRMAGRLAALRAAATSGL